MIHVHIFYPFFLMRVNYEHHFLIFVSELEKYYYPLSPKNNYFINKVQYNRSGKLSNIPVSFEILNIFVARIVYLDL